MPDCECLASCPFFNDKMADMPATAGMMKARYCRGQFENCARFAVFKAKGSAFVPKDLFPNQHQRVQALIDT